MIKITDEELKNIQTLQQNNKKLIEELGKLYADKLFINERIMQVEASLITIYNQSITAESDIIKTYGPGILNIDTGEITEK